MLFNSFSVVFAFSLFFYVVFSSFSFLLMFSMLFRSFSSFQGSRRLWELHLGLPELQKRAQELQKWAQEVPKVTPGTPKVTSGSPKGDPNWKWTLFFRVFRFLKTTPIGSPPGFVGVLSNLVNFDKLNSRKFHGDICEFTQSNNLLWLNFVLYLL